ncbi:SHD1 domain-containing protein [Aureliella helgolandensis]|uniref:SHD1 domain-containing protein n=1 Tax=Aureliella helgolandensis TaxID=2527968 RepID=UPI0018D0F822|nr:SHD1 domain-containing protein [Aureliella helgolandensis]
MRSAIVFFSFWTCGLAIEVGDAVEFQRAGQTFTGKVLGIRSGGKFVEVEAVHAGQTHKIIVNANSIKVLGAPAASKPTRTWSDATGRFKIEATLESQTAFEVVLRKSDGTQIKVPLGSLSTADQEYVAGLEEANANPFETGIMKPGSGSPTNSAANNSATTDNAAIHSGASSLGGNAGFGLPAASTFSVKQSIAFQNLSPPADLEADPSPVDFSNIGNASMTIPEVAFREEVSRPVIISADGTQLCYQVRSPQRDDSPFTKIYMVDGKRRSSDMVGEFKEDAVWLASADPESGDVLGIVMKRGEDKASSLCIISGIATKQPQVRAHWRLFPDAAGKSDHVRFRKVLGNQVAVVMTDNQLRGFDYGTSEEIWSYPAKAFNEPAISPGGRYVACMLDNQCAIVESKTGTQLGSIPVDMPGSVTLGFSPDGLRLAVCSGTQLRVFDAKTGQEQLFHEANVNLGSMGKPIMWLDDQYLLLPSGALLNLDQNLLVWKYNISDDAIEYTDMEHQGLLAFESSKSLGLVRLPHPAALASAKRDTSNIAAVREGESMAVVASASGPGISSADLNSWLGAAVAESGYQASNSATTQLVASISRGETQTKEYRIIGRGFGYEKVTFTPYICKVEVKQNGQILWQRSVTSSLPFMIHGDKTLQESAKEAEVPNAAFFKNLKLPPQILRPEFQNGFGASQVSIRGIIDTQS